MLHVQEMTHDQCLRIFWQKTAAMVSYDFTGCTEEPGSWWRQELLCQCHLVTKPVHVPHQEAQSS